MTVIHVKTESEFDSYVEKTKNELSLLVVDFSAAWCGPCRAIKPKVEALSEQYDASKVQFIEVDVDEVASVASKCGISAMPTFHVYKNGEKAGELVGASEEALKNLVAAHA